MHERNADPPASFCFDSSSNNVYLSTLTAGTSGVGFWRDPPNGTPNWTQSTLIQRPSWRVNCQNATNFMVPAIGVSGTPQLGTTYQPTLTDAPASAVAIMVSGLSNQVYQGLPLPLALPDAPSCDLLVSADLLDATTTNVAGFASRPIGVPNQPLLVGLEIYHQWYVWDQAANAFGFISSNGGRALIRN